ncbi:hypothetical protein [Roseomonas elaeocarpi]|uniref:AAA+ ATPase domain-containing protein n=1 Tax=Roseomonas elaeocarpi TaxID=907779 RepID=A0ABV6JQ53_9PROT
MSRVPQESGVIVFMLEHEGIETAISTGHLPTSPQILFGELLDFAENRLRMQEGYYLDYKHDVPKSFSDAHGQAVLRLALGFYNAFGGLIIFGVQDKTLSILGTSGPFPIEAFNRIFTDFTNASIEAKHARYLIKSADGAESGRFIDVVLISRRGLQKPVRLTTELAGYGEGTIFVRERHEVVQAKARHWPMLYSANRAPPSLQPDFASTGIHRSLPPSPSTMKEFIARDSLTENLWDWFVFGKKLRLYLYGPGGSGKSTLAFEFATAVAEHGNELLFSNNKKLDYVIYLSGKETELNVLYRSQQYFDSKQFSSAIEQFVEILYHSGACTRLECVGLNEDALLQRLSDLFKSFNGLIVLDDIDALSRRKVDTGEEALFTELVSTNCRTRLLYTLRHPPGHALSSSVQVPGLHPVTEFEPFVTACAVQFATLPPSEHERETIFEESGGLPLLIESIVGLRKYSGNYQLAIKSFKDKGGDEARRYLYQREYDRLDKNGRGRQVLAALSLVPAGFHVDALLAVVGTSTQQIADALSECGSIFLSIINDANSGTLYQISPPALPFVSDISRKAPFFPTLEQKVQRFNAEYFRISPREQTIVQEMERLFLMRDFVRASQLGEAVVHEGSEASASPQVRALTGRAFTELGSSYVEKAREHFKWAHQMRYRNIEMLRSWFHIEMNSEYGLEDAEHICQIVLQDERFQGLLKGEFYSKLGYVYHSRAMKVLGVRRDSAFEWLRKAVDAYMEALWLGEKADRRSIDTTLSWLERPLNRLEAACRNDFEQFLLLIELLADRKHDAHVEGARIIAASLTRWGTSASPDSRQRAAGRASKTIIKIRRNFADLDQNVGFKILFVAVTSVKEHLEAIEQAASLRS